MLKIDFTTVLLKLHYYLQKEDWFQEELFILVKPLWEDLNQFAA